MVTGTGAWALSPLPNWPSALRPQPHSVLSERRPKLCSVPAVTDSQLLAVPTCTGVGLSAPPVPSWLSALLPQPHSWPSRVTAMVWVEPDAAASQLLPTPTGVGARTSVEPLLPTWPKVLLPQPYMAPSVRIATEWLAPAASDDHWKAPILTGDVRSTRPPLPTCPLALPPQPYKFRLSLTMASVWVSPALTDSQAFRPVGSGTRVGDARSILVPSPSWPLKLRPQPYMTPVLLIANACDLPAATKAQSVSLPTLVGTGCVAKSGVPVPSSPFWLEPQVHSVPSLRSATTNCSPTATCFHKVLAPLTSTGALRAVVELSPSWPRMFEPQLYRLPSDLRPLVWLPPAATPFHCAMTLMARVPTTQSWVAVTLSEPTALPVTVPAGTMVATAPVPLKAHTRPVAVLSTLVVLSE